MFTTKLTTNLLHAYLSRTEVPPEDLLGLIKGVHKLLSDLSALEKIKSVSPEGFRATPDALASALFTMAPGAELAASLGQPVLAEAVGAARPGEVGLSSHLGAADSAIAAEAANPVVDDALTCLICGKSYKFFRDHLRKSHNLHANDYRKQCGLPDDYPLMAPSVSRRRRQRGASALGSANLVGVGTQLTEQVEEQAERQAQAEGHAQAEEPVSGQAEEQTELAAAVEPAVPIDEAVSRDSVTCLVCGYKGLFLKTHLNSKHDMSVDAYRAQFSLPDSFPLVAPSYSEKRRQSALDLGWGPGKIRPDAELELDADA